MKLAQILHSRAVKNRQSGPPFRILNSSGFTLIELLIALITGAIVITAGFKVFVDQNKNHIIQTSVSDMQQNGRAAVDELVDKIRQAGYLVPIGVPSIVSWNSNPDTIAIAFLDDPVCTATVSNNMPQPSAELKLEHSDLSNFKDNTWAYIYDPTTTTGEFFFITAVQVAAGHMQHNTTVLSKAYPQGSKVFVLNYRKYYVDQSSDTTHPRLMLAANGTPPVIYADNITDLQFHYHLSNGTLTNTAPNDRMVREVDVQVVARTNKRDLFMKDYRQDTLTTRVMVRNFHS